MLEADSARAMSTDYFSKQAAQYVQFRPSYPAALFEHLAALAGPQATVWDCATGNGQAAAALAEKAGIVVATDLSAAQLHEARVLGGVHYVQARAEAVPLASNSIDLLTIAQALHWFDFEHFYAEARRVLRPGAIVAAWTYSFLSVSPQLGADLDALVRRFYYDVIGEFWPPERRWVDDHYRAIPFPFEAVETPIFAIDVAWDLADVVGYISSWSAVQLYKDARNHDPMAVFAAELSTLWGAASTRRRLSWPLGLRLGRHVE